MKKHLLFVCSSLVCLPFLTVLGAYLFTWVLTAFSIDIPDPLWRMFYSFAYLLSLYPVKVLIVVSCVALCVAVAWFQKSKSRFEAICLSVYSVVMLFYFGLTLWCWLTGWKVADG